MLLVLPVLCTLAVPLEIGTSLFLRYWILTLSPTNKPWFLFQICSYSIQPTVIWQRTNPGIMKNPSISIANSIINKMVTATILFPFYIIFCCSSTLGIIYMDWIRDSIQKHKYAVQSIYSFKRMAEFFFIQQQTNV